MTNAAHTPTPLYPRQDRAGGWYLGVVEVGYNLADTCIAECRDQKTAEQLAVVWNAHQNLIDALRAVCDSGVLQGSYKFHAKTSDIVYAALGLVGDK